MNVKKYSNALAMTLLGYIDVQENYTPTFKIMAQIYHQIGSILPPPGTAPTFLQIYFVSNKD